MRASMVFCPGTAVRRGAWRQGKMALEAWRPSRSSTTNVERGLCPPACVGSCRATCDLAGSVDDLGIATASKQREKAQAIRVIGHDEKIEGPRELCLLAVTCSPFANRYASFGPRRTGCASIHGVRRVQVRVAEKRPGGIVRPGRYGIPACGHPVDVSIQYSALQLHTTVWAAFAPETRSSEEA